MKRRILQVAVSATLAVAAALDCRAAANADLLVVNAKIMTLDDAQPEASTLAVKGGKFIAVGAEEEIRKLQSAETKVIDAGGRTLIPGLNDSHLHAVRGGRFYNLELRWDGVKSLKQGLTMIREQAQRTPKGQWVRVIGGWSPYQFEEKRMPTVAELNEAAPNTPVFVLFLYSQALMNKAGVQALELTTTSKAPEGGRYEFAEGGGLILHAEPNPLILYSTIAKLPALSAEEQVNSTLHFYRELNRFCLTSATDTGGGGHDYPRDYEASKKLASQGKLPIRISNYLFAQKSGSELQDYEKWTAEEKLNLAAKAEQLEDYVVEGAGENLVWSAGDFENFMAPRPELKAKMEEELAAVTRVLAEYQWPIRIHATYNETITRMLDVFERVFRDTRYKARWCIDHAETSRLRTSHG